MTKKKVMQEKQAVLFTWWKVLAGPFMFEELSLRAIAQFKISC